MPRTDVTMRTQQEIEEAAEWWLDRTEVAPEIEAARQTMLEGAAQPNWWTKGPEEWNRDLVDGAFTRGVRAGARWALGWPNGLLDT